MEFSRYGEIRYTTGKQVTHQHEGKNEVCDY